MLYGYSIGTYLNLQLIAATVSSRLGITFAIFLSQNVIYEMVDLKSK